MLITPTDLSFHVHEVQKDGKWQRQLRQVKLELDGTVIQTWPNSVTHRHNGQPRTIALLLDPTGSPMFSTISGSGLIIDEPSVAPENGKIRFPLLTGLDGAHLNRLTAKKDLKGIVQRLVGVNISKQPAWSQYLCRHHAELQLLLLLNERQTSQTQNTGIYTIVTNNEVCGFCAEVFNKLRERTGLEVRFFTSRDGNDAISHLDAGRVAPANSTAAEPNPESLLGQSEDEEATSDLE